MRGERGYREPVVRAQLPRPRMDRSGTEESTAFPSVVSWPAQVATELTALCGGEQDDAEVPADAVGPGHISLLRLELAIGAAEVQGRTACATLAAVADRLPGVEPRRAAALTRRLHTVAAELERLVATVTLPGTATGSSGAATGVNGAVDHAACGQGQPHPDERDARREKPAAHPLARVRAAHGWSYQQLARMIARQARQMGVANMAAERQKTWRWEHRGVVPDQLSQRALAVLLGVPLEVVVAHPWPAWLPVGDDPAVLRTMEVSVLRAQLRLAVRTLEEVQASGMETVTRVVTPALVTLTRGPGWGRELAR